MRKKVLVVDDEDDFRNVVMARLETAGYEVSGASGFDEAMGSIRRDPPDLILLDVLMPGVDGFGMKSALNSNPDMASIPVIFLTARSDLASKLKGFRLGVDDYIIKPFDPVEFLARVDSVIKRKEMYDEISMTDAITGLYNTNFFNKQLKIFFGIAKRYSQVFTLAIIDIDDLKKINDTYGHKAGDCILRGFASVAKRVLRQTDIVTRYGGDEFAVILPGVDQSQSLVAMQRLKKEIEKTSFYCADDKGKISFSVSVGIAQYGPDIRDEQEMFKLADSRMYDDKKSKSS